MGTREGLKQWAPRRTEAMGTREGLMKRAAWAALALSCLLWRVRGPVKASSPPTGDDRIRGSVTRAIPTPETDLSEPGILPTQRTPVPAGQHHLPGRPATARRRDGVGGGPGGHRDHCRSAHRVVDDEGRR